MKFVPERLELARGERVTFINRDIVPHTVTAKSAGIESGDIPGGGSWTLKAAKGSEVTYICRLHPMMHGTLVVK